MAAAPARAHVPAFASRPTPGPRPAPTPRSRPSSSPDENDYLAGEKDEIGRQIGGNERELFVSCAPAEALQQQFEHLQPEFIAVHDIATSSSRKLLAGIAAASGRAVQKLVIRRQGYGTALATLEFVDLPTTDNQSLRLYTTEADADSASRHALAKTLLAQQPARRHHGRRAAGACDRRRAEAAARRHPRRPLAEPATSCCCRSPRPAPWSRTASTSAAAPASRCARRRRSPGPADAWAFITGTWSRLREQAPTDGRTVPELGAFKPAPYQPRKAPLAPVMGGMPSGDTMPMEDAAADHADDAADAGDRPHRLHRRAAVRR